MALDVDSTTAVGQWWRHVPAGVDPARRPAPAADNRWQRGDVIDALYLSDSEAGAWAEWYRHLAEAAIPPRYSLPRDLWRYDVQPIDVADLSTPDGLARLDLDPPRPGRSTWPAYQAVGEQLYREGWHGLIAPSAARPGSTVLVVFLVEAAIPEELIAAASSLVSDAPTPPTGMRT